MIAGVDEAGRGALAGNVVAAAVILPNTYDLPQLTDSKKLSAKQRARLFDAIIAQAVSVRWAQASPVEIDRLNIHHASLLAMQRAIGGLPAVDEVRIDGKFAPQCAYPTRAIVGGDASEPAIAAASIIAKVIRDRQLILLDSLYPQYGFAGHKAYPTKTHITALCEHGICALHRLSYGPVQRSLNNYA
ncbi:ribonuclease HII [Suttonella sp. R2A3]|uniref:ribonuclease HII n=1 Tax=Suttonella sp. R2A3 TaxID=2908648 RepID=UPI001F1C48B9|nr:ribonuclease HII [Suttonella sp. R2A3]